MSDKIKELLAVFENSDSNRSIEISGKRREIVIDALRSAVAVAPTDTHFSVPMPISFEMLASIMCSLVESGDPVTREWLKKISTTNDLMAKHSARRGNWYAEASFYADPECVLFLDVDKPAREDTGKRNIRMQHLAAGIGLLGTAKRGTYAWQLKNILNENADASTADIFMQLVVYGEEVYA